MFPLIRAGARAHPLGLLLEEEAIGFLYKAGAAVFIDEYGYDDEDGTDDPSSES
ncbi:hypothetical protein GCM10023193_53110 [Planotetraspora kaengkrachanensis]|uniref:Uncharacterized protein n=1 Tax=Planotetraspora kaengkrachanensis TaxID=575193 RepID=A0A8J3PU30_9ACTN|nr:hypothetical protein Pka01_41950 [Planotetraspora kaengkrachanensis]